MARRKKPLTLAQFVFLASLFPFVLVWVVLLRLYRWAFVDPRSPGTLRAVARHQARSSRS